MRERPILFSAPMVRAILDGRKTQTRRVVIGRGEIAVIQQSCGPMVLDQYNDVEHSGKLVKCPYGEPEDRLWVRETFSPQPHLNAGAYYRATDPLVGVSKWKPSIFMPRRLSRITLEILSIRAERLQWITEADANAEGIDTSVTHPSPTGIDGFRAKNYVHASECFADLWRLINGAESWDLNPWVWVIEFKRV